MEKLNFELRAEVSTEEQLSQALKQSDFRFVYAPLRFLNQNTPHKEKIIAVPDIFLADCEKETLNQLQSLKLLGFEHALAHTVGHIPLIAESGMKINGGMRLNITNSRAAEFFSAQDFSDLILSCELTAKQIKGINSKIPFGIIAYGKLPLMLTRRCPINDGKPCNNGKNCGKYITDRKGEKLYTVCSNTVELLNPNVLSIADKLRDFRTASFFVLRFTVEKDVVKVLREFEQGEKPKGAVTAGLYYRGVE